MSILLVDFAAKLSSHAAIWSLSTPYNHNVSD
jgi:hypothetical protein